MPWSTNRLPILSTYEYSMLMVYHEFYEVVEERDVSEDDLWCFDFGPQ